jgi:hypothetical protein
VPTKARNKGPPGCGNEVGPFTPCAVHQNCLTFLSLVRGIWGGNGELEAGRNTHVTFHLLGGAAHPAAQKGRSQTVNSKSSFLLAGRNLFHQNGLTKGATSLEIRSPLPESSVQRSQGASTLPGSHRFLVQVTGHYVGQWKVSSPRMEPSSPLFSNSANV